MSARTISLCVVVSMAVLTAPAARAAEPIVYYSFDELSPTIMDLSGHGFNGTPNGGVTLNDNGRFGKCFEFNGSNGYVQLERPITNDFTITAWVKADRPGRGGAQAYEGSGLFWSDVGGVANDFVVAALATKLSFFVGNPDTSVNSNGDIVTGEWMHIAAVRDTKAKMIAVYIDGKLDNSVGHSNTGPLDAQTVLAIGGNTLDGRYFAGQLDEVKIFDTVLTATEIRAMSPPKVKARKPNPANGATGVTMALLQWTKGDTAVFHDIYLGTSPDLTAANLVSPHQPFPMYFHVLGFTPGVTYYWRIDEIEASGTVQAGDVWSFTAAPATAYAPTPRNGDKWVATDIVLAWQAGQGAASHEVYFGTDKDAVASRDASAFKGKQVAPSYTPGALSENTTYYWAVDEITGTGTKNVGDLWSFTTITPGGGVKGEYFNGMTPAGVPALSRTDPAIDFSWGDPGGPGTPIGVDNFSARWTADLEIAVADAYTFITSTDDGVRLWLNDEQIINQWVDQGTTDVFSQPIALKPGIYPLRMEYYENTGGAVARLSWQSPTMARQIIPAGPLQPPVRARALYPANGDVNIPQEVTLMWGVGEKALQHQVYFGEDAEAVANATPDSAGIYKGEQALDATSFSPGSLEWNKTYYWRVDEVNDAATDSPWKGAVWSFTTADFIVVDDFESYNDEVDKGTRIYETWIDGQTNTTTATVGNWDPPFAEQTIVHGGRQSMPMDYNNVNSPYYAEAEREFSPLQNWTVGDVTDLTLFFRGRPAAFVEGADGIITMSGSGHDIWDEADDCRLAYKRLSGDGSIVARVDSVANTNSWAKAGVMVRETLEGGSKMVYLVVTPGNGVSFGWRTFADNTPEQVNKTGITAPQWVKLTRKGDVFTAQYSADGKAWTDLPKADGTPVSVLLTGSVYIGLCLTSHDAALVTTATFSNITAGGTGAWQVAAVGDDPEPANSPQSLYLVVEDSTGKSKVITHPDAGAVNVTEWTEWKIPLGDLAGVNLAKVKKLYIGVGDRANPAADGSGRIYVDDIRVTKP